MNFGGGVELKLNSDLPFLGRLMKCGNDKKQQITELNEHYKIERTSMCSFFFTVIHLSPRF